MGNGEHMLLMCVNIVQIRQKHTRKYLNYNSKPAKIFVSECFYLITLVYNMQFLKIGPD